MTARVLVVADPVSVPGNLRRALVERAAWRQLEVVLIVPAGRGDGDAPSRLRSAVARLRAGGLYVRDARVEDDPVEAAAALAVATRFEELLVAVPGRRPRLPGRRPLDARLREATGLPVENVSGGEEGRSSRRIGGEGGADRRGRRRARREEGRSSRRSRGEGRADRRGRRRARAERRAARRGEARARSRTEPGRLTGALRLALAGALAVAGLLLIALALVSAVVDDPSARSGGPPPLEAPAELDE